MAGQQSPYLQFNPNSFFGGRRIDARPRNVEYEEGTGPGTGLTARRFDPGMGGGLDAFYMSQRYKDMPMSMINREANIRRNQGMMYNPYTGTYQRDSMYNRSGFGFGREPVGDMQPQAPAMTEPQQEWARLAQEKQSGAGALGKIGEKMANVNVNPMFGAGVQAIGTAMNAASKPSFTANPYAGTRAQNIANAKAAGMFDKVRADYNKKNEATGMVMDEEGNITRSPEAYSKIKQEERDLMRGMWREPQTLSKEEEAAGVVSKTAIPSRYGRGSVTTYAPGAARPPSMVKDELGRMVPMSPYLKEKDQIQRSKGMTGGSSVLTTPTTPSTIPVNPLKGKVEERNLFPNAIGEKTQFNEWQNKLDEAKKRGAEGMAKSRGKESPAVEQKPLTPSEQRKLTLLERKYGAQGIASDEMKALDADRSAMMVGRNKLLQEIENKTATITSGTVNPIEYQKTLSPQELAEKVSQLEKLEEAIKENYKKSQELGNKRKIPEDVMKEWLELSSRANAR